MATITITIALKKPHHSQQRTHTGVYISSLRTVLVIDCSSDRNILPQKRQPGFNSLNISYYPQLILYEKAAVHSWFHPIRERWEGIHQVTDATATHYQSGAYRGPVVTSEKRVFLSMCTSSPVVHCIASSVEHIATGQWVSVSEQWYASLMIAQY